MHESSVTFECNKFSCQIEAMRIFLLFLSFAVVFCGATDRKHLNPLNFPKICNFAFKHFYVNAFPRLDSELNAA